MAHPHPPKGARMRSEVKNPGQVFFRLLKYLFGLYGIRLMIVGVLIIVSVWANVQGTMFMKSLIDSYIVPMLTQNTPDFTPLAIAIGRVAGFYAIGVISTFTYNRMMVYVSQGTLHRLRTELFTHMEKLPIRYFDSHTRGDIMSVYTNDIDTLRQMISMSLPQLLNSGITIVSVFVSMLVLSVPLTMVTMVMVVVMLILTRKFGAMSGKFFARQQRNLGSLNGYIEEMMSGQKVIKVFCHEEKVMEEFRKRNDELFESARNANTFANVLGPFTAQLGNINYVICAVVGGLFTIKGVGGLTIGALASFLTFTKSFNMPINQLTTQFNAIIMAIAGADRVFKVMDENPEEDQGYVTLVNVKEENGVLTETPEHTGRWAWRHEHQADHSVDYVKLQGDIVLEKVDFGYVPEKQILYDIDVYARPGQKIAFVGSTGAGKTTITNLINRFYDIADGKIRYDGININKIRKDDLRRSLGVVLQETNLFTGTVKENIRFGNLDITDEEIVEAARLANADGFIRRLPKGYDTVLENGGENLSQGQRQLISIARAAAADPPVLILDEATSSIDTRTEKYVQDGMDRLMHGRTTFVIAHRLSTVRNADCIMVLENGHIIERGTHEDLIEMKGRYYQLYTGNAPEIK